MTTVRKKKRRVPSQPKSAELTLIASNEKRPKVALKAGMRVEVTSVRIVDPDLLRSPKIAARLCGGSGTCIALIDVGETESVASRR